jgi:Carboxypeptidase regulatory-like domain
MLTRRRTNRLSASSAAMVFGLIAFPLAVAFAVGPEREGQAAPQAQQPAGAPVAVLRGRVTTKAGAPLPGVRVRVAVPAADMRFVDASTDHKRLETISGVDGDYRLEIPGIANRTSISIDAMMPGFRRLVGTLMAGGDARKVDVEPGGAVEANLALEPARYFRGIVVDEQGRPIPSVHVGAYLLIGRGTGGVEITASGPDGSFELFNYPADPNAFGGQAGKGNVKFSHPDYIEFKVEDIDAIEPGRRTDLRIVLPTGHKVTGTLLDAAGKPVPKAMVEATLDPGLHRKATLTDSNGHFTLRGLGGGPTTFNARGMDIRQKIRLSMALDGDKDGLQLRLQPITWPADLKKHAVLGMQLADVTPELKSAYDLRQDRGALILDPGQDSDRLKIGELAEGYLFWLVGDKRIGGVREFVDQILAETGGRVAEEYSVRVVYSFMTTEHVGTNTQYLRLTKDDIQQLQIVSDRLKADSR